MTATRKSSGPRGVIAPAVLCGAVLLLPACSSLPFARANAQANQFQNLLPAAEKGNLEAEDDLGYPYQTGEDAPADEYQTRGVESSGNPAVDAAVLQAVNSAQLPPPPAEPLKDANFTLVIRPVPGGNL